MTLTQAEKKIRTAWILGLISGFVTLLFTLVAATSEGGTADFQGTTVSLWYLLDVFLIFLLTFGIYRRSRVAAIGMFIYFLLSKLIMWSVGLSVAGSSVLPGILTGIAFLYFYFEGARGAITFHQLRQGNPPIGSPVTFPED